MRRLSTYIAIRGCERRLAERTQIGEIELCFALYYLAEWIGQKGSYAAE